MRFADFRLQRMLRERCLDARDQIIAISLVVGLLELATTAFGEVTARRLLVMWAEFQRPIVEQGIARNSERDMATV